MLVSHLSSVHIVHFTFDLLSLLGLTGAPNGFNIGFTKITWYTYRGKSISYCIWYYLT